MGQSKYWWKVVDIAGGETNMADYEWCKVKYGSWLVVAR